MKKTISLEVKKAIALYDTDTIDIINKVIKILDDHKVNFEMITTTLNNSSLKLYIYKVKQNKPIKYKLNLLDRKVSKLK